MNTVMKQKIFSLLVLMLATVSTAWALVPTYKIVISASNNHINSGTAYSKTISSVPLGYTGYSGSVDAKTLFQEFVESDEEYDFVEATDVVISESEVSEITISGSTITVSAPFNAQATFTVQCKLKLAKTGEGESDYNFTSADLGPIEVTVDVYHTQHGYADDYSSDAEGHWHACSNTNGQCEGDKEPHTFTDTNNPCVCTICGYQNHLFDPDEWGFNDGFHYHPCQNEGCPLNNYELEDDDPILTDEVKAQTGFDYEAHEFSAYEPYECICGATGSAPAHVHVFNGNHNYTGNTVNHHHWIECEATDSECPLSGRYEDGLTDEEKELVSWELHTFVEGVCSVCGAPLEETHEHTPGDWYRDADFHTRRCTDPDCPIKDVDVAFYGAEGGFLTDDDRTALSYGPHDMVDGVCTVCGYHDHVFATGWTAAADGENHYHACTAVQGCYLTEADYQTLGDAEWENHDFGTNNLELVCTKCGYPNPNYNHEHVWAADWTYTEEDNSDLTIKGCHYHKCTVTGCVFNVDDASFTSEHVNGLPNEIRDQLAYAEHSYSDMSADGTYACTCGYTHQHSFGSETDETSWNYSDGYHWLVCQREDICPQDYDIFETNLAENMSLSDDARTYLTTTFSWGAHVYDQAENTKCICGAQKPHVHKFTNADGQNVYGNNDNYHWLSCQETEPACPLNYSDIAEYTDADQDEDVLAIKRTVNWGEHSFSDDQLQLIGTVYAYVCECGYAHGHSFGNGSLASSYGHNNYYHWLRCEDGNCPQNYNVFKTANPTGFDDAVIDSWRDAFAWNEHSYDAETHLCVCGAQDPLYVEGHEWDAAWVQIPESATDPENDPGVHYHKCTVTGCEFNTEDASFTSDDLENLEAGDQQQMQYGPHEYGDSQSKAPGNDQAGSGYYTCITCGYESPSRKAEAHEHAYGNWSYNEALYPGKHFKRCSATEGACDTPEVTEDHEFKDEPAANEDVSVYWICGKCGYVDEERQTHAPHRHEFLTEWERTAEVHYHLCTNSIGECTLKYDGTDTETGEAYGAHEYEETDNHSIYYYTCKVCGLENESRKGTHTHSYGEYVKTHPEKHWKECTSTTGYCDTPKSNEEPHKYGTSGDARWTCSVCGYVNLNRKKIVEAGAAAAGSMAWSWDYDIPFNFDAPVLNDRRMNYGQAYTVCLPYDLDLNGLKAFYIEQNSEQLVGFREQKNLEALPHFISCIVKADKTGNPLNMTNATTIYNTQFGGETDDDMAQAKRQFIWPDPMKNVQSATLIMMGTLCYMSGSTAEGNMIMQAGTAATPEGVFKLIEEGGAYDNPDNRACILPMRGYLQVMSTTPGDSREYLGIRLLQADGSVTTIDRLEINAEDNTVYDLQGRRVENPRKGNLYIVGGRKVMYK